jgi:hypothetical protein
MSVSVGRLVGLGRALIKNCCYALQCETLLVSSHLLCTVPANTHCDSAAYTYGLAATASMRCVVSSSEKCEVGVWDKLIC